MKATSLPTPLIYCAWVAWMVVIFWLSNQAQLPGPSEPLGNYIFKKIGHLVAYAILFTLTLLSSHRARIKQSVAFSFAWCLVYALSDEYHQSFIPGRSPHIFDIGFDMVGSGLAFLRIYGYI
jgi:VanZ family protein